MDMTLVDLDPMVIEMAGLTAGGTFQRHFEKKHMKLASWLWVGMLKSGASCRATW